MEEVIQVTNEVQNNSSSYFYDGVFQLFGWKLLGAIITFFTLGICYPWAIKLIYSWEQRHKVYCKRRCSLTARA